MVPADSPRHELNTESAERESMPYSGSELSVEPQTFDPVSAPQERVSSRSEPGKNPGVIHIL